MPAAPRPPGAPTSAATKPARARRLAALLAPAALLFAFALSRGREGDGARRAPEAAGGPASGDAAGPADGPPAARRAPSAGSIAAALGEEQVALASDARVEAVEQDRPWACAGKSLRLFARTTGEREPGVLTRWLWQGPSGVELEPGATLSFRAPKTPGTYVVRVQICQDLGGRRVGILAEREHAIEVRACDAADEAGGPLRLRAARLPGGAFAFEASLEGGEEPAEYHWDFDDGSTATTSEPRVEHAFESAGLGPQGVRAFAVRVEARPEGSGPLGATAFAVVRGRPGPRDAAPVDLDLARFAPAPEGGFVSALTLRVPPGADVTWERLERVVRRWDDVTRSASLPWGEAVRVDERLDRGGFRGEVRVGDADAGPEVKQVHDTLFGRDATGREVSVAWTPYKGAAPPGGAE